MRSTREVNISQREVLGTELVVSGLVASGRFGANRLDFEGTVLRIAGMIEPDAERLLAWYRDTPIADIDALTAERLVHIGRGREVIAFLCSIQAGARR